MLRFLHIIFYALLLLMPFSTTKANKLADTTHLYFSLGEAVLSSRSEKLMDSLVYNELLTADKELVIIGYTDNLGSEGYNIKLSETRAQNVQSYLAGLGIKKTNVKLCEGLGEVKRDAEVKGGYSQDRRVDIVLAGKAKTKTAMPVATVAIKSSIPGLASIKVGQTLVLRNIYFYAGRHVIREESIPELDKLFQTLIQNPKLKIDIEGHVCCVPAFTDALDEDTNEQRLSVNRARFIYDFLVDKGINKNRLSYQGFGRTRPVIVVEKTFEDEDMNRRVEIRVLEN